MRAPDTHHDSLPDGCDTIVDDDGTANEYRRDAAADECQGVPRQPDDPHPRRACGGAYSTLYHAEFAAPAADVA